MPNDIYYVFDDRKCKAEGMTKEQIINAIHEATGVTPTDVDEGFISTIVETNKSRSLHIWKGTQAEYNALGTHDPATFYIIEDDTAVEDLQVYVSELKTSVDNLSHDTDWVEITRTGLDQEKHIIGYCRVIGKIAYFVFDYELATFKQSGDESFGSSDTIGIPVPIGPAKTISFTTPCLYKDKNDEWKAGQLTVIGDFVFLSGKDMRKINTSFSWPIFES